ncbi:MAG: radical SAM protein [candidate division Zixibacteria bacterium]|nr:radical SAM protein [candidate division Zixibacteria bacterium]
MLLPLQRGILYGPVHSRRYGRSLGINLMPGRFKLCSFNCIYCHYGWTKTCTMDVTDHANDMPAIAEAVAAIEQAFQSHVEFDLITFSGNGEPTLYPGFAELVAEVVRLRDQYRPFVSIALLSNATGLVNPPVRDCISKLDLPVFKLDAGSEETFHRMNRPAGGIQFGKLVELLASIPKINLQTVMVDGEPANTTCAEIHAYSEKVGHIRPKEVHMYSIDRPTPDTRITLVPPQRLLEIAAQVEDSTGVPVRTFGARG